MRPALRDELHKNLDVARAPVPSANPALCEFAVDLLTGWLTSCFPFVAIDANLFYAGGRGLLATGHSSRQMGNGARRNNPTQARWAGLQCRQIAWSSFCSVLLEPGGECFTTAGPIRRIMQMTNSSALKAMPDVATTPTFESHTALLTDEQLECLSRCAKGISLRFGASEMADTLVAAGYSKVGVAPVVTITAKGHLYLQIRRAASGPQFRQATRGGVLRATIGILALQRQKLSGKTT
jgi:hypothetical protein